MAIIDSRLQFGDAFDLDQEPGTYLMTNQVDLGVAARDIGNGQPLYLCVHVVEAFTDGGDAANLTLRLVSDDTAAIHASTSTIHLDSGSILKAGLTLGKKFCWPLPLAGVAYERYLGINCIVGITGIAGFDDGMLDAFLTPDPNIWAAYADATN